MIPEGRPAGGPEREVATTCPYCAVGCGVRVRAEAGGAVVVRGDRTHPANFGRLCSKGRALGETLGEEGRLLHPVVDGRTVGWDEAIARVAGGFADIIDRHGPDAVALYVSGQLLTEDYYAANKLMKGFVGSANIDSNPRLCMSSAVAAHIRAFGSDTVPVSYEDVEAADLVVLVGSNAAWCHPILYQRILAARRRRGTKLVVIDPRRTSTCHDADLHLALRPGTDPVLFAALLNDLRRRDRIDWAYLESSVSGFGDAFAAAREEAPSNAVAARTCDLDPDALEAFFSLFARHERVVTMFSQGVNQSAAGTDTASSIINVHLATGRIGKPGRGPLSITGQPNAMGGREVGGLANLLAAHMRLDNAKDRDRVARFWGVPPARIPVRPGAKAVELFDRLESGAIKAVWIMATNPVVSVPRADRVRRALDRADLVVLSECFEGTDTARHADVLLPAAPWGEKDGTVTNSERRVSRCRPFRAPAGQARPDWWIVARVAAAMGFGDAFAWTSPREVFAEHAALSRFENDGRRRFDLGPLATLDEAQWEALEPVRWPVGAERAFGDGRFDTADGRAVMAPVRRSPRIEGALVLNTGRVRDHWHTMTRTGRAPSLSAHVSEPFAALHPATAAAHGIRHDGLVRVESEHGRATLRVHVTTEQRPGEVFVPMHWTAEFSSRGRINAVVSGDRDPISGQPAFKHTPVRVRAVEPAWHGFVLSRRPLILTDTEGYWAHIRGRGHHQYELAGETRPDDWATWAKRLLGEGPGSWSEYTDGARSRYRAVRVDDDRLDACVFVGPDRRLPSRDWLRTMIAADGLDPIERRCLLAGRPSAGFSGDGALVCACHQVTLGRLVEAIQRHDLVLVEDLKQVTRAGTGCGSCVPELSEVLSSRAPSGPARMSAVR